MTLELQTGSSIAALSIVDGKAPEWVQLFPAGETVKAGDSRAAWKMADVQAVIAASKFPIAIDYDHGTDHPVQGEQRSRASGWIDKLATECPLGKGGVWAHVDWTPAGDTAVASKEYRYLSPVFAFRKTDRVITRIERAALTNNPALEMRALASKENDDVELKALCKLLGLPDTATAEDCTAKLNELMQNSAAASTIALASGAKKDDKITDALVTAICAKLKAPAASTTADAVTLASLRNDLDEANKQIAALSTQRAGDTAAVKVEAAIKAGKIAPAQKDWALDYCARDPAGFDKFAGGQPTILSGGRVAPEGAAADALTPEEKSLCSTLGIKEDDFKAERDAQRKALA
jgi:phage I-like protein